MELVSQGRTLAAGACFEPNNIFAKCALLPVECTGTQEYRTARYLSENDESTGSMCANQATIRKLRSLGRCNGDADRFICTSDETACRLSSTFEPLDGACNLVDDFFPSNSFVTSHYGHCASLEPLLPSFCAWQFSECPKKTHMWQVADSMFANSAPPCRCDLVVTGACRKGTDDFYCAVSEEVCDLDDEYSYITSEELYSQFTETCRLCDTLPPPLDVQLLKGGACVTPGVGAIDHCALEPEQCFESEIFYSSHAIENDSLDVPASAKTCLLQRNVQKLKTGRCTSSLDQGLCTSVPAACGFAAGFVGNDFECNLVFDTRENSAYGTTHYGHCSPNFGNRQYEPGEESYCTWEFKDCLSSDSTETALYFSTADTMWANTLPQCRCDDVRIGACISDQDPATRYCAVNAAVCDDGFSYVRVRDLEKSTGPNMICYLCDKLENDATTSSGSSISSTADEVGTLGYPISNSSSKQNSSGADLDKIVLIASCIGGAVMISAILTFGAVYGSGRPPPTPTSEHNFDAESMS